MNVKAFIRKLKKVSQKRTMTNMEVAVTVDDFNKKTLEKLLR